jgi:hypothetical protein
VNVPARELRTALRRVAACLLALGCPNTANQLAGCTETLSSVRTEFDFVICRVYRFDRSVNNVARAVKDFWA